MNSSTSSFKTELRVLAVVLVALLAMEAWARREETRMYDSKMVRGIPRETAPFSSIQKKGTLFLGNSLFRDGLDADVLNAALKTDRNPVFKLAASGSSIAEWYYYFNTYFVRPQRVPELVVVGFGLSHLDDQHSVPAERLGGYCCDVQDAPRVFSEDVYDFGERVEFLEGMALSSVANREWLRHRFLSRAIRGYAEVSQEMQTVLRKPSKAKVVAPPTYQRFVRFIDSVRQQDARLILVAMPATFQYAINAEVVTTAREKGVTILDLRNVAGIYPKHFKDHTHLTPEGAAIFSRQLAKQVQQQAAAVAPR